MSDEELTLAMAELQEVVRCRCDEAYRDRGLKDPHCECDSAEAVKVVARRIEQLVATNEALTKERDEAWKRAAHSEKMWGEAEVKLAKAVEALGDIVKDCEADYPPSHGAIKYFALATLAEIKGESHE